MNRLNELRISTLIFVLPILGLQTVLAQETTADEEVLEEIVVQGIRGGLQRASLLKREASSFVDAIATTELGRFPDENIAESLQRITGVQINRVRGEGSTVNIRGLPAEFTRVQINGHGMANGGGAGGVSRSFNFESLPSEFISSLEVFKSPTADMDAGGLSGTVSANTVRPLQLNGQKIALSAFQAWESNSGEQSPRASGVYSNQFLDGRFGILVAGAYTERTPETHNIRNNFGGFGARNELAGIGPNVPTDLNGDGDFDDTLNIPLHHSLEIRKESRERGNLAAVFEFAATDDLTLKADVFYSKLDIEQENLSQLLLLQNADEGTNWNPSATVIVPPIDGIHPDSTLFGNDFITTLALSGADFRGNSRTLQTEQEIKTISLGADFERGPWRTDVNLTHSFSESTIDNLNLAQLQRFDGQVIQEPGATVPSYLYSDDTQARFMDPHQGRVLSVNGSIGAVGEDTYTDLGLAIERSFDDGLISSVMLGAKYISRTLLGTSETLFVSGNAFAAAVGGLDPSAIGGWDVAPFTQVVRSGNGSFLDAYSGNAVFPTEWIATDTLAAIAAAGGHAGLIAAGSVRENDANDEDVEEDIFAAYVMANFEDSSGRISGNFGLRVESTSQLSKGVAPNNEGLQFFADAGGQILIPAGEPIEVDRSYTELLPSANLRIDLTDELLLRFSASRTMARPTLTQLSPSTTMSGVSRTITANNPNLDPFIANNVDFGVEWYLEDDTSFTIALFHKDLVSLIQAETSTVVLPIEVVNTPPVPNSVQPFQFAKSSLVNGAGATLMGAELAFQKMINNFGVQGNYTFIDNSKPHVLTYASKHNYNLSGWYESERLAVRLSYTYRDEFVNEGLPFGGNSLGAYTHPRGVLDANVTYNVTDYAAIIFEGINITDTAMRRSSVLGNYPNYYEETGQRLMLGVRLAFD